MNKLHLSKGIVAALKTKYPEANVFLVPKDRVVFVEGSAAVYMEEVGVSFPDGTTFAIKVRKVEP